MVYHPGSAAVTPPGTQAQGEMGCEVSGCPSSQMTALYYAAPAMWWLGLLREGICLCSHRPLELLSGATGAREAPSGLPSPWQATCRGGPAARGSCRALRPRTGRRQHCPGLHGHAAASSLLGTLGPGRHLRDQGLPGREYGGDSGGHCDFSL